LEFKSYTTQYISDLHNLMETVNLKELENMKSHIKKQDKKNSRIYIIGNGGSASTASHMANDLGTGLKRRNILSLDIVSLCDNTAISSALANDIGYQNIFYMQLRDILKPEDTVIAISCSGNSPNIIEAVKYAQTVGSTIIGLTGFSGGELKNISDINVHFSTSNRDYGLVEDAHMIVNHILYSYFSMD